MLANLHFFLLVVCDTAYTLNEDYDFATVQDNTIVDKAIDVYDNIEQNKTCLSYMGDGATLVEKENIINPGKQNIKLFVRLIVTLILFYFYFILIIVETFDQNLINIQYDIASEFIEEQNKSQSSELNNPEVTEEGKI